MAASRQVFRHLSYREHTFRRFQSHAGYRSDPKLLHIKITSSEIRTHPSTSDCSPVAVLTLCRNLGSATSATAGSPWHVRPALYGQIRSTATGGAGTDALSALRPSAGGKQDQDESNGNTPRSRVRKGVPCVLLGLSFFTKKDKDEVQQAAEKLKNVDELEMFLRRAKLAESHREWGDAEEFYHQALSILNFRKQEKIWEEQRVLKAQVHIYDNMANLALSRGRLKDAELLYKETVKGLLGLGREKDDNGIVEISLKLAMIYAMQQRQKEAEAGYVFCMNTMDRKMAAGPVDKDTLALYGMCINSYSRFLIIHNRLREAEAALEKTLAIALQALSAQHEQIAVLYSDLATVATMQGNNDLAKERINKAIDIAEKVQSADLSTYLCNKGLICMDRDEFAEGEKSCNRALRLAKKDNDKDTQREAELCLQDIKERKKKTN